MQRLTYALALLLAAGAAFAGRPHHPPPPRERMLAELLELTPAQQAAWEQLDAEFRAVADPLHDRARALRDQVDAALDDGNVASAGKLMLEIRALHAQVDAARAAADAKFIPLLSGAQKEKFEAHRASMESRRKRRAGGGRSRAANGEREVDGVAERDRDRASGGRCQAWAACRSSELRLRNSTLSSAHAPGPAAAMKRKRKQ